MNDKSPTTTATLWLTALSFSALRELGIKRPVVPAV